MKKTTVIGALVFCVFGVMQAQTQKEEAVSTANSTIKENALKAKLRRNEIKQAKQAHIAATNKLIVKSTIDENDAYMGRKVEFLGNLTVSELPADFPKYDKSYGLRYYNNLVDNYYGSHKDILKPKTREKIEYHYPSGNTQPINSKQN